MTLQVRRTITVVETWTVTFGDPCGLFDGAAEAQAGEYPPAPQPRPRITLSRRSVSTESVLVLRPNGC